MLGNLLHSVTKHIQRSNSNKQTTSLQPESRNDREEDGFLLVGQTASERTTVYAKNFRVNQVDAPPNYNEVLNKSGNLPSYKEYASGLCMQSPTLDASKFPGIQYGSPLQSGSTTVNTRHQCSELEYGRPSQWFTVTSSNRNAISDVPFVLGEGLQLSPVVSDSQRGDIFRQKAFDFSLYDYDFSLERSLLREEDMFIDNEEMEVAK